MDDLRAGIVTCARGWIGTRWHHQARVKGVGCDCAGLLIGVARELELADIRVTGYARIPDGHTLLAMCNRYMARVPRRDAKPGDAVLMRMEADPQHLALLADYPLGGLSIIHAYAPARHVIETRMDDLWTSRVVAAFRLPGVV